MRNGLRSHVGLTTEVLAAMTGGILLGALRPASPAYPQILDTFGQDFYRNTLSIIDLTPQDAAQALPELTALVPAADQQALPRLLGEMGETVKDSYQQFKEVVADEEVTQAQCTPGRRPATTFRRDFNYLILPQNDEAGGERVNEYRSGIDGKSLDTSEIPAFFSEGFAAIWTLLYPGNQPGSDFRLLGQQPWKEHNTDVIGFAQKPGWANVNGFVVVGSHGRRVLILYQGVVWLERTSHKVLKLRADLLKPRLDVGLELQTTEVEFGEARVSDKASTQLWVPMKVTVETVWSGQIYRNEHLYSHYRLPGATSAILPVTK